MKLIAVDYTNGKFEGTAFFYNGTSHRETINFDIGQLGGISLRLDDGDDRDFGKLPREIMKVVEGHKRMKRERQEMLLVRLDNLKTPEEILDFCEKRETIMVCDIGGK